MLSPWAFRSASGHIMYHCMVTKGVTVKVLVIHNLRSGLRNGAVYDFMRSYAEQGDSVTIRSFGPDTELAPLLEDAAEYDFVVASGGDGTIASVSYELRNTGIPILPFPAGTANLLALNLFEPNESHALCKLVDEALTLDFDMGEIEATDGTKLGFTIMAGCGYDELIMRNATGNKHLLGDMAYFEAAFSNPKPQVSTFTLTIDGETVEVSGIGVVLANFSKIQFDLQVADENLPRDGKLDVVVLKTENAIQLLPTLMAKVFDHSQKKLAVLRSTAAEKSASMQNLQCGSSMTVSPPRSQRPSSPDPFPGQCVLWCPMNATNISATSNKPFSISNPMHL